MPLNDIPLWVFVLGAFEKGAGDTYDTVEDAIQDLIQDEDKRKEVRAKIKEVRKEAEKDPRTPFES